jgi:hypothetical protein
MHNLVREAQASQRPALCRRGIGRVRTRLRQLGPAPKEQPPRNLSGQRTVSTSNSEEHWVTSSAQAPKEQAGSAHAAL